jgi:hypothetical protein
MKSPVRDPLTIRKILTEDGRTPPGSIGWGYVQFFDPLRVCDGGTLCRMWPVKYDKKQDAWIVTGDGYQMEHGEVVQTFPLED